jgi:hypothetical protein
MKLLHNVNNNVRKKKEKKKLVATRIEATNDATGIEKSKTESIPETVLRWMLQTRFTTTKTTLNTDAYTRSRHIHRERKKTLTMYDVMDYRRTPFQQNSEASPHAMHYPTNIIQYIVPSYL